MNTYQQKQKKANKLYRLWKRTSPFFPHPKSGHQSRLYTRYLNCALSFRRQYGSDWQDFEA